MPGYTYYSFEKNTRIPRKFTVKEAMTRECPVSIISREPRAAELVKLFHKTERQGISMQSALGLDEAWIEDMQELFETEKDLIEREHEKAREKRR